jgi:ribonuclease BN (tRNA processing enzyme)
VTRVVCVGTSDAFGTGARRQSSYLVQSETGGVLMDCSGTTLTGLEALRIPRDSIDVIAITHFHGDHFGGVPLLLLAARFVDRRHHPLVIAGPPGIEERIRGVARAVGHPLPEPEIEFPLRFHEYESGLEDKIGPCELRAFECVHSPETMPHGLVVTMDGHRVAYSGDTGWFPGLPDAVRGVDVFLCECTQAAAQYPYHLSLEEMRGHHAEFDCGRIFLTHLGPEMLARETAEPFELAEDGLVIEL